MRVPTIASSLAVILSLALTHATSNPTPARAEPAQDIAIDAAEVQKVVDQLAKSISAEGAEVSAAFFDVESGKTLAQVAATAPKNPASNAKLYTAAAALSILGGQHRFVTGFYGSVKGGVLETLVLRGRGDPTFDVEALSTMAKELRVLGVEKVGRIVVDQSFFQGGHVPPAFEQQPDEWAAFRAPIAAVSLDRNTFTLSVRPTKAGEKAAIHVEPPGFLAVEGSVSVLAKGKKASLGYAFSPDGDRVRVKLSGGLAEGSDVLRIVRRVDDPRRLAGYALAAILREQGVAFQGDVTAEASSEQRLLVSHVSPSLGVIVRALGKESDNFTAEMLLVALGATKQSQPLSSAGASVVEDYLRERKLLETGTKIVNGSGLFDANRATASGLVGLLTHVHGDPAISSDFVSHLAVAGVDGTLRNRLKRWSSSRSIVGKTGTLSAAFALSGYILRPRERAPIAYAVLVSGGAGHGEAIRKAMDLSIDKVAGLAAPR